MPHLDLIQRAFGPHDVTNVSAHVGGAAATASESIGAEAYATGNSVAFRESPDLHTAAHEAAHVVQQRGGVQLKGGVGEAGDVYEQNADAVADAVVRGDSAAELLGAFAGNGSADKGSGVQRKLNDKLEDKEAIAIVELAFQDAGERAYKAIKVISEFEGPDDVKQAMFGALATQVQRAIEHALDVFVDDDKLKKRVHRSATLAASNMLVLAAMGLNDYQREFFDLDLQAMEHQLEGWKRPSKASGPKRVDLDRAEGVKVVRLDLEAARAEMLSSLALHNEGKKHDGDIWGTGGAMYFEHAISVLGSKDMKSRHKTLRRDVARTRDIALRLMDWAPNGKWSLQLRRNINALAEIVGIDKLPSADSKRAAEPGGGGAATGKGTDHGDLKPGEATAAVRDIERFRTARENAADHFETLIELREAAVFEIDKEIDSKDPQPKSFWADLAKGLAMAALSAATAGIGGAVASAVVSKMASGLAREGVKAAAKGMVDKSIHAVFGAASASGDAGSSSAKSKDAGNGDGDWSSEDTRAAFFGTQLRTLSQQKDVAKANFRTSTTDLMVMAYTSPAAARFMMGVYEDSLRAQISHAAATQRKWTAAKWALYNVQTQMGGTINEINFDPRKDEMYEMGYRGTDMRKAAAGTEATNKGVPSPVNLQYENVHGLIDIAISNSGPGEAKFKIRKARMAGMNSKLRKRFAAMNLREVGIPIRIHGDMYGKEAGHEYMIITRNEQGSILIQAAKAGKEFLAMNGDGDYNAGAGKIFETLLAGGSLKAQGIKLDD